MQNVYLSDITMMLADCDPSFSLSFREKIELAKLLDRLNLSAIELGEIRSRKIDSLLIKSVAAAVKHSVIAVPISQDPQSIEITWAALKDAKHPRLQLKAPMSPAQMEYFWHKKPAKLLESIQELISCCREKCTDVEFIADDACRAERGFLYQAIKTAIAAGATAVTLCDAAGLMFPAEFSAFISDVRANVPEIEGISLGVQCSNALSMAGACAMAAVRAGACTVKTACYAGDEITRTAEFAAILRSRGDELMLSCDIRHAEIRRISGQVERMCAAARGQSALFASAQENGEMGALTLSQHDDRAAVIKAVEKLGYDLSEEDAAKVFDAFRAITAKKDTIGVHELDAIVASEAMQVPPTYRLDNFVINCGNVISASAHMRLQKDGDMLEGIGLGDGPIDAAFHTIEQIIGRHYELDDFQIRAVTEGREAMGEAVVRLRSDGKLYSGRGISTDIVGSSIQAYLSALNKIAYEEAEA